MGLFISIPNGLDKIKIAQYKLKILCN